MSIEVGVVSVVPSPYQRDLFAALAERAEIKLRVWYLEAASPDSPWPEEPLAPYEAILPGFWFSIGTARCHVNRGLGDVLKSQVVLLNTLISFTAQRLMRLHLRGRPWIFWGERLGPRRAAWHRALTAPLHRASAIAGIGTLARRDYESRFPEPRHFDIPYCCDLNPFLDAPRLDRASDEVAFLFCGQMIARKGVDLLLEAFANLVARGVSARLLLVGREAELPALLATLPLAACAQIEYAGFQPPEKLPDFFARADVFVLPSRYDGWGVVVNQALGAGLPIICSDAVGAAHDLVEPEVNGIRFPNGDAAALAHAMFRLGRDRSLAKKWGAASRSKASEFQPARGAERWVRAIQEVMRA